MGEGASVNEVTVLRSLIVYVICTLNVALTLMKCFWFVHAHDQTLIGYDLICTLLALRIDTNKHGA